MYGWIEHRLGTGPEDEYYVDEGLDPRKSRSRAPGEKLYVPRGGPQKKQKVPKRQRLTAGRKRQYLETFPSAAKVAAAQATKPEKYRLTTTSRPLTLNAPGWRVTRVPIPSPEAERKIKSGQLPGLAYDGELVRTYIPLTRAEKKAVPPRTDPVPEDGPQDAYAHFLTGKSHTNLSP